MTGNVFTVAIVTADGNWMWCRPLLLMAVVMSGSVAIVTAHAETLAVGASQRYKMPSEAAAVAMDGDTIAIDSGEYVDCAVWKADRLTITGIGPKVVIRNKSCNGKGLFIVDGNDITIRNLTLLEARGPNLNGAGIRAEGFNLKIDNVRILDSQNGILAAGVPGSAIEINNSAFTDDGNCKNPSGCGHGIYIGHIKMVRITNSRFFETKEGHHIKSRALRTEVIGNRIRDGSAGTASYSIDVPNGGSLIVANNTIEKGPNSTNKGAVIVIGAEGVTQPTVDLIIRANKFTNDNEAETVFVRNMTASPATLTGNTFKGKVEALTGEGQVQ